jgi:hypothetical protein
VIGQLVVFSSTIAMGMLRRMPILMILTPPTSLITIVWVETTWIWTRLTSYPKTISSPWMNLPYANVPECNNLDINYGINNQTVVDDVVGIGDVDVQTDMKMMLMMLMVVMVTPSLRLKPTVALQK